MLERLVAGRARRREHDREESVQDPVKKTTVNAETAETAE
jgi:hypothetical protein